MVITAGKLKRRQKLYSRNKKFSWLFGLITIFSFLIGFILFSTAPYPGVFVYTDNNGHQQTAENFSLQKTIGGLFFALALIFFLFFSSFLVSMMLVKPQTGKIICKFCGASYDADTSFSRCLDCMKPLER